MKNTKIKQRKCPFGKVELCDSYGNCGDCTWCKVIEKYEKKIKALQDKNAELLATAETEESHKRNLQTYIDNHEEIWKRNTEIAEEVARKETAKEITQELLGYIGTNQKFCIVDDNRKNLIYTDGLLGVVVKIAKRHGVEVEQ